MNTQQMTKQELIDAKICTELEYNQKILGDTSGPGQINLSDLTNSASGNNCDLIIPDDVTFEQAQEVESLASKAEIKKAAILAKGQYLAEISFQSTKRGLAAISEIQQFNKEKHSASSEYKFIKIKLNKHEKDFDDIARKVSYIMHGENGEIEFNKVMNAYRCFNKESLEIPVAGLRREGTAIIIVVQANVKIVHILK